MSPCVACGCPDSAPAPTGMCILCATEAVARWGALNPYSKRVAQKARNASKKKATVAK